MASEIYQTLRSKIDDRGVQTVTLNRPQAHNAMNRTMITELAALANRLQNRAGAVRAVILTGEGTSFCAGGDLKWMQANMDSDRQQRIAESRELGDMLRALNNLPQLLVGRVNGQAYGGGVGLISVCDVVIGHQDSQFALTEVKLGLVPANIAPFLYRRIGESACRRTMLNARRFDAQFALEIGLLDAVVPGVDLDDAVEWEIRQLLSCAPGAVAASKKLIQVITRQEEEAIAQITAESLANRWETEEAQHGVACFFSKKNPHWIV